MNTTSEQTSRVPSTVAATSLTERWLLWGLPARLGVAAARCGERASAAGPGEQRAARPVPAQHRSAA